MYLINIITLLFFICISTYVSAQEINFPPSSNGEIINHQYYALSYLEQYEQPEWVAYYIGPDMLAKKVKRKDNFKPNLKVKTGSAIEEDYVDKRYDIGHLLPR